MQWLGVRCQSESCINGECQDQKFWECFSRCLWRISLWNSVV